MYHPPSPRVKKRDFFRAKCQDRGKKCHIPDAADRELIPLRVAFECNFPEANISTVKKIDFMIYGGAKLHRYRTL